MKEMHFVAVIITVCIFIAGVGCYVHESTVELENKINELTATIQQLEAGIKKEQDKCNRILEQNMLFYCDEDK